MIKTSYSHPLRIDSVRPINYLGAIGMTFCPGKKQRDAMSGGHWDRDLSMDINAILRWGATALLNLIEDFEIEELQITDIENALVGKLTYFRLPITDGGIPDAAGEEAWGEIGADLRRRLIVGQKIVIHCKGGLGRTGVMAARLLTELGEDPESAIRRVRDARPGAIENALQEEYLRKLG